MKRTGRFVRWMMIVGASGVLPAFIMRCDKAALNLQRSFFEELGEFAAGLVVDSDFLGFDGAE